MRVGKVSKNLTEDDGTSSPTILHQADAIPRSSSAIARAAAMAPGD